MTDTTISEIADIYRFRRSHWDGHFVYRGERSVAYALRPKFGRHLAQPFDAGTGRSFPVPKHERSMLNEFKRCSPPFLDRYPTDDWDWLAVAQHHGLATRLLDWTENILVAAYFACSDCGNEDAVIYALDTAQIAVAPLNKSPFSLEKDVIFHPRHSTARITAQAGLFTSHADPARPFVGALLQRIIVPASLLIDLKVTLATYGVNKAKLFPGLDTIAEDVNGSYGCD